jgi:hypothetical protein
MPMKTRCVLVKPPIDFTKPNGYNRGMLQPVLVVDNANDNNDDEA